MNIDPIANGSKNPSTNNQISKPLEKAAFAFHSKMPDPIKKWFELNYLDEKKLDSILYPKVSDLKDPFILKDCQRAAERLVVALERQEKILIYGDYDLDGTFGIILLYEALKNIGFKNLYFFQPSKSKDGYGLHARIVQEQKDENNIDLIITVDVGITGIEAADMARKAGVELIITDHHLPNGELPNCFAIVNPNQDSNFKELDYLSGCGVAFYLIRGLYKLVQNKTGKAPSIKPLLPYFGISTITDMVPLVEDNRILVKYALDSFDLCENLGLRSLMKALKVSTKGLSSSDIGLTLAPKINAITRVSDTLKPVDLLFQKNSAMADEFVDHIIGLNETRKSMQENGFEIAQKAYLKNPHKVFIFFSEGIHHGVTGLIASKLSDTYGGTFLIGALDLEKSKVVGSGRSTELNLVELMSLAEPSWIRFGGHSAAAGFEFDVSNFETIKESLQNTHDLKSSQEAGKTQEPIWLEWSELSMSLFSWLQFLEPFGVGFEEPVFGLKSVTVRSVKIMKEKHIKMMATNPMNQELLTFVMFNLKPPMIENLMDSQVVDILFKIKKDTFIPSRRFQYIAEKIVRTV